MNQFTVMIPVSDQGHCSRIGLSPVALRHLHLKSLIATFLALIFGMVNELATETCREAIKPACEPAVILRTLGRIM